MRVMITVSDLAEQMHMHRSALYEWARREDDPLPLRTANDRERSSVLVVAEFVEWWKRNSRLFKEAANGK